VGTPGKHAESTYNVQHFGKAHIGNSWNKLKMKKKYPQYPITKLQRDFIPLEESGFNITLSAMAQNIIEFKAPETAKDSLYERINKYQPEFLQPVKNMFEQWETSKGGAPKR